MSEETMKENKAIRILFQKLTDEKYKQRECKNVFIISVVPKGFKNSKYDEFEKKLNQVTPNTRRFGISERKTGINSPDFYYQGGFLRWTKTKRS